MIKKDFCLCGEKIYSILFYAHEYPIILCLSCHQIRTLYTSHHKQKKAYDKTDIRIYIEKEKEFRRLFQRVVGFIMRYIARGIFVDIGAGVGLLVSEAKRAGFDAYGFEPSKPEVQVARKYVGVSLVASEFNPKKIICPVDVVVLNHVLEHIEDPVDLIQKIYTVLRTGGFLFIGVPNIGNIIARLKNGRWQSLIPDQHHWHFTNQTLDQLIIPLGFVRMGSMSENHDRSMHPWWKRPVYFVHDIVTSSFSIGEAILVAYKKI